MKETLYFFTHDDLSRVVIRLCLAAFPEKLRSLLKGEILKTLRLQ